VSAELPMLVAVAPNGARRQRTDHPALPLTPRELAQAARACLDAGACLLHLHVRDAHARHSLAPEDYRPALAAIRAEVGDALLIQVTSEAARVYQRDQQLQSLLALQPESASLALRELLASEEDVEVSAPVLAQLAAGGTLLQYILYSPAELQRFNQLLADGVLPAGPQFLLFVLGSFDQPAADSRGLGAFLDHLGAEQQWMCCAFGQAESSIMGAVARAGGHARVGFENNLLGPDGLPVADNAALVRLAVEQARAAGRRPATAAEARQLLRGGITGLARARATSPAPYPPAPARRPENP
jgi:3-keto-5-aminohexanoate cleavage enzyme